MHPFGPHALTALTLLATTGCLHAHIDESTFYRPGTAVASTISEGLLRRNVEIPAADGTPLRGFYIETPNSTRTLLYFYGNDSSAIDEVGELLFLANRYQVDVLCLDYRGYGFTPAQFPAGQPKIATLLSDSLTAYDYLAKRSPGKAVVPFGFSLGTIGAIHVAAHRPVAAVVLRAPGTSLQDMVDAFVENLPFYERWLVKVEVEPSLQSLHPQPIEDIGAVRAPLLVIHGRDDDTIRFKLGEKLFAAATGSSGKRFCAVDEANHDDLTMSNAKVRDCVDAFLGVGTRQDAAPASSTSSDTPASAPACTTSSPPLDRPRER